MDSDELNTKRIDPAIPRQLVLDYLLHNCYGETARAFMNDDQDVTKGSTTNSLRSISQQQQQNMLQPQPGQNGHLSNGSTENKVTTMPSGMTTSISVGGVGSLEKYRHEGAATSTDNVSLMDLEREGIIDHEGDSPMEEQHEGPSSHSGNIDDYADGSNRRTSNSVNVHGNGGGKSSAFEDQLKNLEIRKEIRRLISKGEIGRAIELCNRAFPGVVSIDQNSDLTTKASIHMNFKLQCQQFIELVRAGPDGGTEALAFAQEVLRIFGKLDKESMPYFLKTMDDYIPMIAYPDPEKSIMSPLLAQSERDNLADIMNSAILGYNGMSCEPALLTITKQATLVRELLAEDPLKHKRGPKPFGKWRLSSFLEERS